MANDLYVTQDGSNTLFSKEFGFTYRSKFGAVQECQHIYIDAGLRLKSVVQQHINVLEIGFGTGLNAYMTYLEAQKRNLFINYIAYEGFPVTLAEAMSMDYPAMLQDSEGTIVFEKLHTSEWNYPNEMSSNFTFKKMLERFENLDEIATFDVVYFDPFAPDANPFLWSDAFFTKIYDSMRPNGILTTYCAQGEAKRAMKRAGFTVERLPGANGKREMTRAVKL